MNEQVQCVVCNQSVPKSSSITLSYQGATFSLCGVSCQSQFNKQPAAYAAKGKKAQAGANVKPRKIKP